MELLIFKKTRRNDDGKPFSVYISKLTKKDGSEVNCSIRFKNSTPVNCPCFISVDKKNANLSKRDYVDMTTGEKKTSYTLWVNEWLAVNKDYVDHSLDEFAD